MDSVRLSSWLPNFGAYWLVLHRWGFARERFSFSRAFADARLCWDWDLVYFPISLQAKQASQPRLAEPHTHTPTPTPTHPHTSNTNPNTNAHPQSTSCHSRLYEKRSRANPHLCSTSTEAPNLGNQLLGLHCISYF